MAKTIFILIDGCSFELAKENLGFLEHLIEWKRGAKYKVMGELPSLSRPIYETLHTGLGVIEHGIVNNLIVRRSSSENIFKICCDNGLKTGAAAYFWMSELYNKAPFDYLKDRIQLTSDGDISQGIFYYEDDYPDSHVFNDGEFIRNAFDPDFLLIHSMNIDDSGHKRMKSEQELNIKAAKLNMIISTVLPMWLAEGYSVVVTADHGMNEFGLHGGNSDSQRVVPMYIFSDRVKNGDFCDNTISQLCIAPLLCDLLGVDKATGMKNLSDLGVDFFE